MEKLVEQGLLYDFYGELLTNHQKEVYEQFVLEDLSLSEIAESAGISRQGVHDLIKRCNKILEGYDLSDIVIVAISKFSNLSSACSRTTDKPQYIASKNRLFSAIIELILTNSPLSSNSLLIINSKISIVVSIDSSPL